MPDGLIRSLLCIVGITAFSLLVFWLACLIVRNVWKK